MEPTLRFDSDQLAFDDAPSASRDTCSDLESGSAAEALFVRTHALSVWLDVVELRGTASSRRSDWKESKELEKERAVIPGCRLSFEIPGQRLACGSTEWLSADRSHLPEACFWTAIVGKAPESLPRPPLSGFVNTTPVTLRCGRAVLKAVANRKIPAPTQARSQ